jgi:hypothetical protein
MPELDFAGLRTVAMEAARQPEFPEVQRRAARVRRRRRVASAGAAAAAVILAIAGTGYAVGGLSDAAPNPAGTPGPAAIAGDPPAGPVHRVVYAYAGDATHLYAVTQSCDQPSECPYDLYGSDDAGRTWHGRTVPPRPEIPFQPVAVLGPRTLLAGGAPVAKIPVAPSADVTASRLTDYVSADGGATWRELTDSAEPIEAVPAGHRALFRCESPSPTAPCTVRVVDPVTARLAALANQPPIAAVGLWGTPPEAGLWVSGFDPVSHRPAVAWSRDAGRTWTPHVFAEADPVPSHSPPGAAPTVATADGRTAYAMVSNDQDVARIYRTVDGGATWWLFQQGKRVTSYLGYVSGDGAHLLMTASEYLASRDGRPYRPERLKGLPGMCRIPEAMAGGGYLTTVEADPTAVYLSDDGLTWRRAAVQ